MGIISFRVYLIIAFFVFLAVFAVQFFDGAPGAVSFLEGVRSTADRAGLGYTVANFILGPMIWSFDTYVYGPILVGLLWPVAAIWIFLFVIVWIFSLMAPGLSDLPG